MEFLGVRNPTYISWRLQTLQTFEVTNFMSIIIIVITNITLLASRYVICFGCFMCMSHAVNKKAPTITSPHPIS